MNRLNILTPLWLELANTFVGCKEDEPSRCIQHRNGSNIQHAINMQNAARSIPQFNEKDKARFWGFVEKSGPIIREELGECWIWAAYRDKFGYGQFQCGRSRERRANRIAWILERGPISDGICVLHHCDNPSCVNPTHLFVGTHADNVKDKQQKGRSAAGDRRARRKSRNSMACFEAPNMETRMRSQLNLMTDFWISNARAARRKASDNARRLFPWLAILAGASLAWFIVKTAELFR